MAEIMTNAVNHGYGGGYSPGWARIQNAHPTAVKNAGPMNDSGTPSRRNIAVLARNAASRFFSIASTRPASARLP